MTPRHARQHPARVVRLYTEMQRVPGGILRALWLALLLVPGLALAVVLDPPALRCASVNVSGDVTLTWTTPPDPNGDFAAYEIHHATSAAGPFTLLYTINAYGQISQFHPAAGANTGAQFYYMTTVSNSLPAETSIPSDTVATLFLEVFQSTPLGNANLSWTAPATAPTAGATFSVWLEYPIGTWTLLDEVPTTTFTYQHAVSVCEDSLTFRIGVEDDLGCTSFSNLTGDVFADATPPSMPVLTTATVDSVSGLSVITWSPSPEPDTDGYIIVWVTPSGGVILDTLYGQNNTTYTWLASQPGFGSESFTVAAFDTCEVGIPPSPNTSATRPPHSTVFANTLYDKCAARTTLYWTHYVGWDVQTYQVFAQVDGGVWSLIGNLPGTENSYVHEVQPFRTYCYIVKAIEGPGLRSVLSNKTCRITDYPPVPTFNYIRTVTVTGDDQITLVDSVDVNGSARIYRIERSDNGAPFTEVATIGGGAGPVFTYVDDDVSPESVGYRYRVIVEDSCGREAVMSNVAGNIVLQALPHLDGTNYLDWNGYAEWAGQLYAHVIHRQFMDHPMAALDIVGAAPWSYDDDVSLYAATDGRFCYYVQAVEFGNPSGINATSESNVVCAVQQELIYIPNAFTVGGYNPVFQPVLSYADITSYELSIINRWGQVIWTTNDPTQPWDGSVSDKPCPIGVYGYYCAFLNGAGQQVEKRGTVTLLTAYE